MMYYLPTQIIWGSWDKEIGAIVKSFGSKQLLLVADGNLIKKSVILDKITGILEGCEINVFNEVSPNPGIATVEHAQKIAEEKGIDLVIGIGGGSVMDVAKVVASNLKKPCVEIPTTAGTGSEVTPFAALYTDKKKESLTPGFPTVALVDWKLCKTMPREVAASSGMDVLSQAIEAYWSIHSTPITDVHAERAIKLSFNNLEGSLRGDEKSKENMSLASLEAGMAFSQTKTTAVHSVSYPFSVFYKVPHGFACALTLPYFLVYNSKVSENDCLDVRGVKFVKERINEIAGFLKAKNANEAKSKILELMKKINAPLRMMFDVSLIIGNGFSSERVDNNPRKVTEEGLRKIFNAINK